MSSAFPQAEQPGAFSPAAMGIIVEERGQIIPGSYVRNSHRDLGTIVKQDGLPVLGMDKKPFTIAQVAPERRWAVLEDGNLMSEEPYRAKAKENVLEFYAVLRATGRPDAKYVGNVDREPIQDAVVYVPWRVDPEDSEKLLQIGFDPNATDGAISKRFHTREGKEIEDARIDVLCQAFATEAGRKQMTEAEIAEVEAQLGVKASEGSYDVAAKLEMLTDLHDAGDLADDAYRDAVAKLTGTGGGTVVPIRTEPEPDKTEDDYDLLDLLDLPDEAASTTHPPAVAVCGRGGFKPGLSVKAHERQCDMCRKLNGLPPAPAKKKRAKRKGAKK